MKRPSLSLTNATTIAERGIYRHQSRQSHRILKVQVLAIGQDCSLSRAQKKCTSEGSEGTKCGCCEGGQQHPSRGPRRSVLRTNTRGVSCQSDPPVRRSGKQQLGFGQQFRVRSLGGFEESRRVDHGQRSKKNSCRESGHSYRCLAPLPFISLLSEGVSTINFDPRDIYSKYPTNFCTMAAGDDVTKEEVSVSRQGPVPT